MTARFAMLTLLLAGVVDSNAQSLAEVARQERERRSQVTSTRVYTNETLARLDTGLPVSPGSALESAALQEASPAPTEAATARTEEHWRELFSEARQGLTRSEQRRELAEQQIAELQRQFLTRDDIYNRENRLGPEIQARQQELTDAEAAVAAATRAIFDLGEELRRAGAPAGWAR